jgi:hypothetical protein
LLLNISHGSGIHGSTAPHPCFIDQTAQRPIFRHTVHIKEAGGLPAHAARQPPTDRPRRTRLAAERQLSHRLRIASDGYGRSIPSHLGVSMTHCSLAVIQFSTVCLCGSRRVAAGTHAAFSSSVQSTFPIASFTGWYSYTMAPLCWRRLHKEAGLTKPNSGKPIYLRHTYA